MKPNKIRNYRIELDGLRALAVLSVIFYHAELSVLDYKIFQGGYFGVDVFFVLSGYLITSIIKNDIDNDNFSYLFFLWRRICRIIPNLYFVIVVTSICAYFFLLPSNLSLFSESLNSSIYFWSNYYFSLENSYTAPDSSLRLLLHTWSLSVEWQFYIIFPLILFSIVIYSKLNVRAMLLIITISSFFLSTYVSVFYPDWSFYMLPSRAWELLCGAILVYLKVENFHITRQRADFLSILGLLSVVYCLLFVDNTAIHPSFITLFPVVGTCVFILFSGDSHYVKQLFSSRWLSFIGVCSFSLYLWHQPVFAFFKIIHEREFNVFTFLVAIFVTCTLAFLSYYVIERRFRKLYFTWPRALVIVFIAFGLSFFSYFVKITGGIPDRLGDVSSSFVNLNDNVAHKVGGKKCHGRLYEDACQLTGSDRQILLIGDSHAGMLGKHLYYLAKDNNWGFKSITSSSCIGIESYPLRRGRISNQDICDHNSPKIQELLTGDKNVKYDIVYSIRQDFMFKTANVKAKNAIHSTLSGWADNGHRIFLIYPVPKHKHHVPDEIKRRMYKEPFVDNLSIINNIKMFTSLKEHFDEMKFAYANFDKIEGGNITRIYPVDVLCDNTRCYANLGGLILYFDDDHLSTHGAKLLVKEIENAIFDKH
ncbi:acyltransferase [Vibrio sp. 1CM2L]|uniref:acyltransferase family protein n=1 Tax=Vibrio sp. 1CM2L TaxID=2929166 RepID=UPI0020BF3E9A|nr:acyltransferase family protein [Vibrio sp. 1CM2L]MCK8078695.1 acyltransferase [Vibrio sp. 1CM2L]